MTFLTSSALLAPQNFNIGLDLSDLGFMGLVAYTLALYAALSLAGESLLGSVLVTVLLLGLPVVAINLLKLPLLGLSDSFDLIGVLASYAIIAGLLTYLGSIGTPSWSTG